MDENQVRQIVQQMIDADKNKAQFNVSAVPFHAHNGLDAPQLQFIRLSDTPHSYDGQAGKFASVNSNETALQFSTGGAGLPGGLDTDIQFNDSSNFGGEATFTFDKTTKTVTLGAEGANSTFQSPAATTNATDGGTLVVVSGNGKTTGQGGSLQLDAGNGGATGAGGNLVAAAGSGGTGAAGGYLVFGGGEVAGSGIGGTASLGGGSGVDEDGGAVTITGGDATGTGDHIGGAVSLTAGTAIGSGNAGVVFLTGGTSDNSQGGDIFLFGGTAGSGNNTGGDVLVAGGVGHGTESSGDVFVGNGTLATNANGGFVIVPTCAGAATGSPHGRAGAMVYDTSNHKLYIYEGAAWKSVTLT